MLLGLKNRADMDPKDRCQRTVHSRNLDVFLDIFQTAFDTTPPTHLLRFFSEIFPFDQNLQYFLFIGNVVRYIMADLGKARYTVLSPIFQHSTYNTISNNIISLYYNTKSFFFKYQHEPWWGGPL